MPPASVSASLPSISDATRSFERWLGARTRIVEADLAFKHEQMATSPFSFLRATFYRWMQLWPLRCPDLAAAPHVLAVGDLHTENFGSWRDAEGRLVWGVNDFDEAYPIAYTNDLVRLAASVRLTIVAGRMRLTPRRACDAIANGYRAGLKAGGKPFVLAEQHEVLRKEAENELRDPIRFWQTMDALPVEPGVPDDAARLLRAALPRQASARFARRRAGLGSLGHQRFVAIAEYEGGHVAREVKALVPSACVWAAPPPGTTAIHYPTIVRRAVRCADPFLTPRGDWVVRRLAPDCSRIEVMAARLKVDQELLMHAMGAETANIHLGTAASRIKDVLRDLDTRPADWLRSASKEMCKATLRDYGTWTRRPADAAPQAGVASSRR